MSVSIVMPVYNEEEIIESVVRQCHRQVIARLQGSELIVVNDASTDSTPRILERLARDLPQLRVIDSEHAGGHSRALRAGLSRVKNPLIFHIDSDGQFKAEDFWKLYPLAQNYDIVLGWRTARHDPLHRRFISLAVRLLNAVLFKTSIRDINSPFKLIKTRVFEDISAELPPDPFAVSIIMVLLAQHKGYRIAEVPIDHCARTTGKSKLTSVPYLLKGCFWSFGDILKLWMRFRRS